MSEARGNAPSALSVNYNTQDVCHKFYELARSGRYGELQQLSSTIHNSFNYFNHGFELQDILPSAKKNICLPSPTEVQNLLEDYLRCFHPLFPLFHEDRLRNTFEKASHPGLCLDSGSQACIYMVLAISYKLQQWGTPDVDLIINKSWFYFQAAMRLLPNIAITQPRLSNIQALALMSIFLRGSIHFNNAYNILGAAISHANCLHIYGEKTSDISERRAVYETLFSLDKEFSLQLGSPPLMKVDNPTVAQLLDDQTIYERNASRKLFSLAQIQERIYQTLYSPNVQQNNPEHVLRSSMNLDRELESWAEEYLTPCECCRSNTCQPCWSCLLIQLMYNNSVVLVHRLEVIHCPYTGLLSRIEPSSGLHRLLELSARKRDEAAASSIRLVQRLPRADRAPYWLIPSYIVESVLVLLTSITFDSDNIYTQQHIEAINSAVAVVQSAHTQFGGEFAQMLQIVSGAAEVAKRISTERNRSMVARRVTQVALDGAMSELRRYSGSRSRKRRPAQLNRHRNHLDHDFLDDKSRYPLPVASMSEEELSGGSQDLGLDFMFSEEISPADAVLDLDDFVGIL
ncbi:hypothetical protein ASPBRDRAFT_43123 [Aspergillus brasiliensis CBS 101740]|uniref:Xylanolytic transcriptional activator regulatory domain-containing protein n=1 Tax=Aspergillus brasiliensis (strain CBS 101740 / IMI 381727 / IBT 21946) TaxID=767769 RepID=A0A1L9UJE0_ASPBC|nr:hypothetical protein ASPBRDRAFT_43123 [Aspergillus brasiliensis CBS 101740]